MSGIIYQTYRNFNMVGAHYLSLFCVVACFVVAQDPFYMCTDNKCESCPSAISSTGTGYPNCVIYSSEDVFARVTREAREGKSSMCSLTQDYPTEPNFANASFAYAQVILSTSTCRLMSRVALRSSGLLLQRTF